MSWRNIRVGDEEYRWSVSVTPVTKRASELSSLRVTVIVRGVSIKRRVTAVFHGYAVEDLFEGRQQSISVTPRTVAEILRRAPGEALIDHAERVFPAAVTSADPEDALLRLACFQWFVPYPGRQELEHALKETNRDFGVVAQRFSTSAVTLTAEQIAHWSHALGI